MEKEILINHDRPKAIGPYSSALKIGKLVFTSGQLPIDPITGEIVEGDIDSQTKQSLENLKAVLKPYSIDFNNIVKVTIFLKNMNHFSRVNDIYSQYFINQFPSRSCIEVSRLPKDAQIEIEAIAYCNEE
ncbi:MAG: RidA family protein [Candidatus Marinimicrobia bacterium]|nr:RidA family protein [Candidatus Neomarinimicrobiota bacterium]